MFLLKKKKTVCTWEK